MNISLITICRNSARTIGRTIESVIAQGIDDDLEYIIVDGASEDGTIDIITPYIQHVHSLISEPDNGIADAFNKGIRLSKGEIIGIINSDDILLPGTAKKIVDYFARHQDAQVVHGDVLLFEGNNYLKRISPPSRWWHFWRFVLFNHPATFVKRQVYEKYGLFNTDYKIAMDVEIFSRWLKKGVSVRYLPEPLVGMQAGGVSGRHAFRAFKEARNALRENGYSALLSGLQYLSRVILHAAGSFLVLFKRCH